LKLRVERVEADQLDEFVAVCLRLQVLVMTGQIARKGEKAPVQAGQRWPVERANAWHNAFNRLQRCYERRANVIDAFFDLADAIITVRSMIRQAWTSYRWDGRRRPAARADHGLVAARVEMGHDSGGSPSLPHHNILSSPGWAARGYDVDVPAT
jgi:hypothetical protein